MIPILKKAAIFSAGFFTCLLCCFLYYQNVIRSEESAVTEETNLPLEGQKAAEESAISIRMNDGMIEWYDGKKWNAYETSDSLLKQDPYYLAKDNLDQFEEELIASYHVQSSENSEDVENANENVEKRWTPLSGTIASAKSSSNSGNSSKKSSSGSRSSKSSGTSGSSNSNSGAASADSSSVTASSGESAVVADSGSASGAEASTGSTDSGSGAAASGGSGSGAAASSGGSGTGASASSGSTNSGAGTTAPSDNTNYGTGSTAPSGGSNTTGGSSPSSGSTSSGSSGDGQDTNWSGEYE
jgi:hypothetical protein